MRVVLEAAAVVVIAVMMLGPLAMAPAYGPYVEPGTAEEFEAATTPLEEGSSNVSPNDGQEERSPEDQESQARDAGDGMALRPDGATLGSQTPDQRTNAPPPNQAPRGPDQ